MGNEAQLVDAGDEGADEAEVNEGDEEGVGARAVVGEQRGDGPGGAEDRDDEQDQDVVRGESVGFRVDVDEPGEHAEGGDLWVVSCEVMIVAVEKGCLCGGNGRGAYQSDDF